MDCSKDFRGQEYADHVKCVTEDQKYGGSQYVAKEMKGEKKQEAWIAKIKEQVANTHNMEPQLKELLDRITTFSNIPRKKEKFVRFLNNSARVRHSHIVDKAWEVFEAASKNNKSNTPSQNGEAQPADDPAVATLNGSDCPDVTAQDNNKSSMSKKEKKMERQKKQGKKEKKDRTSENTEVVEKPSKRKLEDKSINEAGESKKRKKHPEQAEATSEDCQEKQKKKKRKHCDENEDEDLSLNENHSQNHNGDANTVNGSVGETPGFKWKVAISQVLQDAPEKGMKMTKLQRKILSLYFTANSESSHVKSENEVAAMLKNKLKKRNDKYIVCKDRVKLRTP